MNVVNGMCTLARALLLIAAVLVSPIIAWAQAFIPFYIANVKAEGESRSMNGIRGSCAAESHIAVGPVGTDLSSHQTPFVCDAALLTLFDNQNIHSMITFAQKATTKGVISFAGTMHEKVNILDVQKVYFEPGKPTYIDDGACKFFFSGRHMTSVYCVGKIDADGQRTVASIVYNVDRGQ
jgi:hypothetical protein